MAKYPKYDFSDPNLDYNSVLQTDQMMYSDILHQGTGCCKSKSVNDILSQVDVLLQSASIDGDITSDLYNEERWKEDVKDAYLLLQSFFRLSADVSPEVPVVFPQEAIDNILRGKQYLSNLNTEYIEDLKKGCTDCKPSSFECLKQLLRALDYKNNLDQYDDIAIALLKKVQVIVGSYIFLVPGQVAFGYSVTNPFGNLLSVSLPNTISVAEGDTAYIMTFPDLANLNYPVIRELATEPLKDAWSNTINNFGFIPDSKLRIDIVGLYRYYYGRIPFAFDAESMDLEISKTI